jgi:predicted regulator of Ras-like GTPase activity (Roadblock/LC7/MglB family)
MAYSEIINEIQEQINDINALIVEHTDSILVKQAEIEESEERVTTLQAQLVGLAQLKVNAQSLVDNQNTVDINLNVNVSGAGEGSSVIRHAGSTDV